MTVVILQFIRGMKRKSSVGSAKLRGSAKAWWFTLSITSWASESKASNTCDKHIDNCNVGAEDWLVHIFELNKGHGLVNYLAQHQASQMRQPAGSDDFGWRALMDRNGQRDQLFQTKSSVAIQSRSQRPNQSC